MKIHIWVPDYVSAMGGIQSFSRSLTRAIGDSFPSADISVLVKNDTSVPPPDTVDGAVFRAVGHWSPRLRTAAFASALFRATQRDRPQLIVTTHVNFTPVARVVQRWFDVPYLAIGHGVEVWRIQSSRIRQALRSANGLVAVSEFTRQRMAAALNVPAGTIAVLPNTFDPEKFQPQPKPRFLLKRYGLRPNQPVILTIARLASEERYKGYDQVLRALPEVKRAIPNLRYILGGRGPDRPRVVALIKQLELEETVILTGYVPDHELCAHYNLCDVFAMPSKGEGFGIVFLEALACAKPVIAGNKDGSVDALLYGKFGLLIDPDDVKEIEATLIQLLQGTHPNPVLRDPPEFRRRVIEAYGYERFKKRLSEILEPLLEKLKS